MAEKEGALFSYDIIREGEDIILSINCETYQKTPSLEEDPLLMSKTIDILAETGTVTKIVFAQKREYEYDYATVQILLEIAKLYNQFAKQKITSYMGITDKLTSVDSAKRYSEIQYIVFQLLKADPLAAFVESKRILRHEKIMTQKITDKNIIESAERYISILNYIASLLEKTKLISLSKQDLEGYKIGDRTIYTKLFTSTIRPDFMFTKLMTAYPEAAEEVGAYALGNTEVTIFTLNDSVQNLYHIIPPEFKLTEEKYDILDTARKIMAEHKPKKEEFVDPKE